MLVLILLLIVGASAAAIAYFVAAGKKRKEKKAELVETVILPVLNEVFDSPSYDAGGHISGDVVRASRMVRGWSRISGSDYICGWHDGLKVQMSDLLLTHTETRTRTNSKGETETYTVTVTDFSGQWVICDFDKQVAAQLTLRAGGFPLSGFLQTLVDGGASVEMDSTVFNDSYRVLTDNPHDAFYILTPPVMERILAANQWAKGCLSLEYQPWGELHLAIGTHRNFFEPLNIWRDMDYAQEYDKTLAELHFIIGLIDQLRLEPSYRSM
jgi:hypothetical protein